MDFITGFELSHGAEFSHVDNGEIHFSHGLKIATASGCVLHLVFLLDDGHSTSGYSIDLKNLDPLSVSDSVAWIHVETTGSKPSIPMVRGRLERDQYVEESGGSLVSEFTFSLWGGREATQRLERALKHAMKLCGATVSPF